MFRENPNSVLASSTSLVNGPCSGSLRPNIRDTTHGIIVTLSSRKSTAIARDSRIIPENLRSFSGARLNRGNQRSQDDMKAIENAWVVSLMFGLKLPEQG